MRSIATSIRGTGARQSARLRLTALQKSMLTCARCTALVRCRSRVVPGAGAVGAAVEFVGIAPGRLSGDRSGDLLRAMIAAAGLRRVFITNLVRCNPRDAQGRNRDPRPAEIANCRRHLEAELALVRPRIVACLGRMAWLYIAGKSAPFDPVAPAAVSAGRWKVYPMYHPAYVNRGAYPVENYARDFNRLRLALEETTVG